MPKFTKSAVSGVKIGFRFLNGNKVLHTFQVTDVTKVIQTDDTCMCDEMFLLQQLYEFVFAMATTDVDQSFRISKVNVWYAVIVTLQVVDLSTPCTLVVDGDVLDLLEDNALDEKTAMV